MLYIKNNSTYVFTKGRETYIDVVQYYNVDGYGIINPDKICTGTRCYDVDTLKLIANALGVGNSKLSKSLLVEAINDTITY